MQCTIFSKCTIYHNHVKKQWPRNRGVRGCNCNPRFQKLSHKNAIKRKNPLFWGCFATPATLAFGSLCGPCLLYCTESLPCLK